MRQAAETAMRRFGRWRLAGWALIGLLGMQPTGKAQMGAWERRADMPTARTGLSTSVINGTIYAIGGTGKVGENNTFLSRVEAYHPKRDTWERKTDMPTPRTLGSTIAVDGKIYAIGGNTTSVTGAVEAYDPITDTWTRKADMPTPRTGLSTSLVNGKIYAIGGFVFTQVDGVATPVSTVEVYDPMTDTWTLGASMPAPSGWFGANAPVIDGRIYVMGGAVGPPVFVYNPETDAWTHEADLPDPRLAHAASVVDGVLYVIGGFDIQLSSAIGAVTAYDRATDAWTPKADMLIPTGFHAASVADGRIYVFGGRTDFSSDGAISTVEAYDPMGSHVMLMTPWDVNADGVVNILDLVQVASEFGQRGEGLAGDVNSDGIVNIFDLVTVAYHFGERVSEGKSEKVLKQLHRTAITADSLSEFEGTRQR